MRFPKFLTMFSIASIAWTFLSCTPCCPQEEGDKYFADGWLMFLHSRVLGNYLKYKGSTLNPLTEVTVTYKLRDPKTSEWGNARTYEVLWFSHGRIVGCKRYDTLSIEPGTNGQMIIEPTKNAELTRPITSTVVRLLLDVYSKRLIISQVVLPEEICWRFSSELAEYNFYPKQTLGPNDFGILLHILSDQSQTRDVSQLESFDKYYFLRTN